MAGDGAKRLLDDLETAWRPLRDAVDAAGVDALDQQTRSGWLAKELVAHLAFWEEAIEGFVTLVLRQQALPDGFAFGSGYELEADWPPGDVHNAREAAWAREQTSADVLDRWDAAHGRLVRFLETVSDTEATTHTDYFASHIADHLEEHRGEFDDLRSGRRGPRERAG